MALLPIFGLYFVVLGGATMQRQQFDFDPLLTLSGEAAVVAGEANILAGIVVAVAALLSNPLPLLGIAAVIIGAGVGLATARQRGVRESSSRFPT